MAGSRAASTWAAGRGDACSERGLEVVPAYSRALARGAAVACQRSAPEEQCESTFFGDIYNAGKLRVVGSVSGDEVDPVALARAHFDRTAGLEREDDAAFVIECGARRGNAVTGDDLSRACKIAAAACGLNPDDYASHSLRIGGASALAAAGFHDWEIAILGRWTSMTFLRYLRMGVEKLSGAAARMARTNLRALLRR